MDNVSTERSLGISTWLTLDNPSNETSFPSAGSRSSDRSFQEIYWRCVGVYFLTARIHNPSVPLIIFCDQEISSVAPAKVVELLASLEVTPIRLDLNRRLPRGSVSKWGSVFYELDIVKWQGQNGICDDLVITDSDCVWRSTFDPFKQRLADSGCLIYTLEAADQKNYEGNALINGMSVQKMREVLFEVFEKQVSVVRHNGGEFLAITREFCAQNSSNIDWLWSFAVANAWEDDSIKTEEHFWNIIAKLNDIPEFSANDIVRRMWTNFEDRNITAEDLKLPMWHLPSEKKYGFRRMWDWWISSKRSWTDITPSELNTALEHFMGVPKRGPKKMFLDVTEKLNERIRSS